MTRNTLEQRVMDIQVHKNNEALNRLITEYEPFIISVLSATVNRYIEIANDDLLIIGLEAFSESIERYEIDKGAFLYFAKLVIRSRALNYLEKEKHIPTFSDIEREVNVVSYSDVLSDLQLEILEFEKQLAEFSLTLEEIAGKAPQHKDTLIKALQIAEEITHHDDLVEMMFRTYRLPVTKISKRLKISSKVLKRSKTLIIATVIIKQQKFELINEWTQKGTEKR